MSLIGILVFLMIILSYSLIPSYFLKGYGISYNKEPKANKFLCLTFDDGPDERYTNRLLDLLKYYNIKATFFVVAKHAESNSQIIERIKYEGHSIGLHSLEHRNALWQLPDYTRYDFDESMKIMQHMNNYIKFYRPPWGHFNLSSIINIKRHGLKLVLWDVMAEDWRGNTTSEIIAEKLIRRTKNRSIICLHDGRGKKEAPARTIEALEKVLPVWIEEGYQFLKVDELYE